MHEMYSNVTINLSHLASTLIMQCIANGQTQIGKHCFYATLYIAIKRLQQNKTIHWHRSLLNPEDYVDLLHGKGKRFENFISMAEAAGLLSQDRDSYYFLQRLCEDYHIDAIRTENLIAVYHNEAAPIEEVANVITETMKDCDQVSKRQIARWSSRR